MDWLAQCQNNVTEWDITVSALGADSLVPQWGSTISCHECTQLQVGTHPDMTLAVPRT